jgi:hypothetical protein
MRMVPDSPAHPWFPAVRWRGWCRAVHWEDGEVSVGGVR